MGDQATGKTCGTGRDCEQTCPVMRLGRVCPDWATFLEEMAALRTQEEASSLVPATA